MASGIIVSEEVRRALAEGAAVVALESTIVSHGMPFPQNLDTALRVEAVVRKHNAVPATIAILDGVPHVGLSEPQLRRVAKLGYQVKKCARRDLAYVFARKLNGATTVAATMYLAHQVGIRVFVTGGIGGVHRGHEHTLDVSGDLTELGRTPVAVVCAGVKSILDIPRTMEFLETQGVPVVGLRTKQFPAFFTAESGVDAPIVLHNEEQVAGMIRMTPSKDSIDFKLLMVLADASEKLRLSNGIVIGVPVPKGQAAHAATVERATQQALQECNDQKIVGRDVTPFLLKRVNELTGGHSLQANIALILNNAKTGALIAASLACLQSIAKMPKSNL